MNVYFFKFQLHFANSVLVQDRKINEWLTLVEKEIRLSLAGLLAQAVSEIAEFRSTDIDQSKFMEVCC